MNKISVVISTYNQPEFLELALKSLANQIGVICDNYEVIVADDGSNESTAKLINQIQINYRPKLLHIWHPDDGFRKSMILNKAVLASTGDYLLFVDGDCVVNNDFIYNHLQLAEKGYFVAGNRVLLNKAFTEQVVKNKINLQNISSLDWLFFAITKKSNKLLHWLRLNYNGRWRKMRQSDWRYPKGCNIGVWKSDYIKVNGYDELFTGWGHEDADFFIRLLHSGVLIKDGRFSVPVLHLWHKLAPRVREQENFKKMMAIAGNQQYVLAECGFSNHLTKK